MSGSLSPDQSGVDPHEHHRLIDTPTQLNLERWIGVCKCGHQFRGNSREDIYTKAQLHTNQHTNYGNGRNDTA